MGCSWVQGIHRARYSAAVDVLSSVDSRHPRVRGVTVGVRRYRERGIAGGRFNSSDCR